MIRLIQKVFEKVAALDQDILLSPALLVQQVLVNMQVNPCHELLVQNRRQFEKPVAAIAASLLLQKTRIH